MAKRYKESLDNAILMALQNKFGRMEVDLLENGVFEVTDKNDNVVFSFHSPKQLKHAISITQVSNNGAKSTIYLDI
jgi:hypothetical protein